MNRPDSATTSTICKPARGADAASAADPIVVHGNQDPAAVSVSKRRLRSRSFSAGGPVSTMAVPPVWRSCAARRSSTSGSPPIPMLPSARSTCRHCPVRGKGANRSWCRAEPPRALHSATAAALSSTPNAAMPPIGQCGGQSSRPASEIDARSATQIENRLVDAGIGRAESAAAHPPLQREAPPSAVAVSYPAWKSRGRTCEHLVHGHRGSKRMRHRPRPVQSTVGRLRGWVDVSWIVIGVGTRWSRTRNAPLSDCRQALRRIRVSATPAPDVSPTDDADLQSQRRATRSALPGRRIMPCNGPVGRPHRSRYGWRSQQGVLPGPRRCETPGWSVGATRAELSEPSLARGGDDVQRLT